MTELEKIHTWKREIALIETFEEIKYHESKAAAFAELARKQKLSKQAQDEIGVYRVEVEAKKGEWLEINYPQGVNKKFRSCDNGNSQKEIGINPHESSNARLLHNEIEQRQEAITEIMKTEKIVSPHSVSSFMRKQGRHKENEKIKSNPIITPEGLFDVIVIDPPWQMEMIKRNNFPNQIGLEYPTMTIDEISNIKIPANDDCHIWLWTTHKYLPQAFEILKLWNLKYICTFVWHKQGGFQPFNLPQYNCEFALYARKGTPKFETLKDFKLCFEGKRGRHSEKPKEFYDLIGRVTSGRRLDMFSRKKIEGYEQYGNEVETVETLE